MPAPLQGPIYPDGADEVQDVAAANGWARTSNGRTDTFTRGDRTLTVRHKRAYPGYLTPARAELDGRPLRPNNVRGQVIELLREVRSDG